MRVSMLVLAGALALSPTALCVAYERVQADQRREDVEVEIVSDRGELFQTYPLARRPGADVRRAYLEARDQARYRIRVRNRVDGRVGLVIAVDGRNIISGARSELARGEPMYILEPGEGASYEGWRTSESEVHEFYFTDWNDSYAEAFGDASARGVIAIAAFRERVPVQTLDDARKPPGAAAERSARQPAPATTADQELAEGEPGTGFGEEIYSPVRRVAFDSERAPALKYLFKYEWRETLCQKRVVECAPRERNRFWDEEERLGFAPFPPGR